MMSNEYETQVFSFIQDVMIGIELKVWDELEKQKERIKTPDAMYLGSSMIEFYLTNVHKALFDKNDQLICETFEDFSRVIPLEQKYI